MTIIEIEGLNFTVDSHVLLDEVSLRVEPGQWLTVVGPNGAGKTTLVECVAGVRRPSSGAVRIEGHDMSQLRERDRARLVAFVPQHPVVPSGMSVLDYVGLGRTAHHGVLRALSSGDRSVVHDVMERLSLSNYGLRDVATLSGGERQRVVLARALAQETRVMVLDEPTTGLDLRHQFDCLWILQSEVRDNSLTVVATLHDLTLAGQFADRLALLRAGRLMLDGSSSDVVRSRDLSEAYEMDLRVIEVDGADVVIPSHRVSDARSRPSE
jgi:iron complex transport system ATP-binding protein